MIATLTFGERTGHRLRDPGAQRYEQNPSPQRGPPAQVTSAVELMWGGHLARHRA